MKVAQSEISRPKISVIVLGHPITSHPATSIITETLYSIRLIKGVEVESIIVSHDGIRMFAGLGMRKKYKLYLENLENGLKHIDFESKTFKVIKRKFRGHLNGNIRSALQHVETEFILVVQQDFPFVREVELKSLINLMRQNPRIRHLRFNKNENKRRGWDAGNEERQLFFRELGTTPQVIQTLAWSDENHLTRKSYYQQVVFPILGKIRTFPESILNQLSSAETHELFGTYVVGGMGDGPMIRHLDGSLSDLQKKGFAKRWNILKRRFMWSFYFRWGKLRLWFMN